MKRSLFLIALLLTAVKISFAQQYKPAVFTDPDRLKKLQAIFPAIDKMYKDYAEKSHFPGLVYGIVLDGKLIHTGSLGYANLAGKIEAASTSDFRIASMSKSFVALAILKLRDQGKLKLDDPLSNYIPEIKNGRFLTKDAPAVTIRHLLTHAAGFPEDNPWGDRQLAATDAELLAIYKKGISFSNDPGLGYEYSNVGFATLGYVIKKVTGISYQEFITKEIFKPLGMTHTYWEYSKVPKTSLAHGYRWVNGEWIEQPLLHDGAYGAMGGLITTIEDMSKYMALHMGAWPPRDDTDAGAVKRSSIREMHYPWNLSFLNTNARTSGGTACPNVTAYGYGIRYQKDCNDRVYVGHTGGLPGFGGQWNILPEYGIGVVSFANLTYGRTSTINTRVLDTLLSLAGMQPRELPPSAALMERKNQLIKLLPSWKDASKQGIFADNFFLDYFIDKLKADAESAFAKAGKITDTSTFVAENQLRGYFLMKGESATIKVSFTLTPQNPALIQEYRLSVVAK